MACPTNFYQVSDTEYIKEKNSEVISALPLLVYSTNTEKFPVPGTVLEVTKRKTIQYLLT
jgi:hypothetical protein